MDRAGHPRPARQQQHERRVLRAPDACTAVGFDANGSAGVPFAERWDGTAWTLQAAAIPPGGSSGLDGVSCPTASTCFAVGTGTDSGGSTVPLAEKWDGTRWTIQATPEPAGAFIGALLAVSCRDTGGCTAAGTYYKGIVERILIERLRNGRWNVQRAPNAWWPARAKIRASPRA